MITHVMIYMGPGDCRVLGASGGNSATTTIEIAKKIGAQVHYRRSPDYRPDLKGYRKLPDVNGVVNGPK